MATKKQTYQERAEQLAKVVDIADKIIRNSTTLSEESKLQILNWGQQIKHMALNPEPPFKKVASIKYLENDFLTYWNESSGPDIEKFWAELNQCGIDFKRKDIIQTVLKRKKIKDIHEYDGVIDNIVVGEQRGQINNDQVIELNKLIEEFEKRKSQRVDKKRDVH